MWSAPSLPLLPGSLRLGVVVVPDRVLLMGQIELNCIIMLIELFEIDLFWQLNCVRMLKWIFETVLMLNWIVWNRTDYLYQNGFGLKQPTKVDMP